MTSDDLDRVQEIAATLHPDYPERRTVFADRLTLFPAGCLMLNTGLGYAFSHPAAFGFVPPLDTELQSLPSRPEVLYLHDVALLPDARKSGAVEKLLDYLRTLAGKQTLSTLALCAVAGKDGYWRRHGFSPVSLPPDFLPALHSYDAEALYMTAPLS